MRPGRFAALVVAILSLTACSVRAPASPTPIPTGLTAPFEGYTSATYAKPSMWLCSPDNPKDVCHGDLTATEIKSDLSRVVVPDIPMSAQPIDCFYVYPTVDLSLGAANHQDFHDLQAIVDTTVAQAAHFREACSLYVPLYRQVTIGSYALSPAKQEPYLATAFSDVADAFLHYMGQKNHGRRIVLLGHSQGAEMVVRLLKRFFDDDETMRSKLVLAMAIGGDVQVAKGQATGGTFRHIPICTRSRESGCIVAYRSFRAPEVGDEDLGGEWNPPAKGRESACVDPADMTFGGPAPLSASYFPVNPRVRGWLHGVSGVQTPFVLFRRYYTAECVTTGDGFSYLAISTPRERDDARVNPVDFDHLLFRSAVGLHILDYQLAQGDLVELVKARAAGP